MSAEMTELLINVFFVTLLCLPVFLITWLATRHRKVTNLKTDFSNPRKEAMLSIAILVSISFVLALLIFLLYLNAGGTLGTPSQYTLGNALFEWGLYSALFIFPVLAVVKLRHQSFETVGITRKNAVFSTALGLVSGLILTILIFSFGGTTGNFSTNNVLYGFVYFLAVGFGEELLFRGYLQLRCTSWLGTSKGLILASVIMAFYHLPQRIFAVGLDPLQALVSAVGVLPLSLALGFLMLRTKNTLGPAIMHTLVDWIPSFL